MPKFRKRPVVIEAERAATLISLAAQRWGDLPGWFIAAYDRGLVVIAPDGIHIKTLAGVMLAEPQDWVIQGVEGELYPCTPSVFQQTYESVL